MGVGANIGNTFDNTYAWETGWKEPLITQTYINGMASHGIKTVRVPVAWDTYAINGVFPSDKMARVHQVVQWIVAAGMYYYTPSNFCILAAPANYYGTVWTNPATTWGTTAEKTELATLFATLKSFSTARSIPVIIGEFAVIKGTGAYVREPATRILWALTDGMVPLLWDTGADINHTDGSFYTGFQSVMTELGY
jgi:hypothetical protein